MVGHPTGKKKVLLSLVSQQAMPIITAILQYGSDFDRYDFLITNEYENVAKRIIGFLRNRNQITDSVSTDFDSEILRCLPYDTKNAKEVIDKYILKWKDDYDIVINITNGTKLMSIAGYCAAIKNNLEYIYVESKERRLICGNPSAGTEATIPFDEAKFKEIDVEKYLELNGQKIKPIEEISESRTKQSRKMKEYMSNINKSYFFSCLKKYFEKKYENEKLTGCCECDIYSDDFPCSVSPDDRDLLSNLNKSGILKFRDKDNIVSFDSLEDFRFFNGSWLEVYSKYVLDSSGMFDDVRTNLTFIVNENEKKSPNTNEWDVFVVAQGKFALIECKSTSQKDIDKYGKLKAAQKMIDGENSSAFMISFKPIDSKAKQYCDLFKINAISGTDIDKMAEKIAEKMNIRS